MNNIVSFLTRSGGAVYVKETEFNATNTDLIIVSRDSHMAPSNEKNKNKTKSHTIPSHLACVLIWPSCCCGCCSSLLKVNPREMYRLPSESAGILQCRMNPSVMFVKDINYLENCCKTRLFLPPPPSDIVYPSGIHVD